MQMEEAHSTELKEVEASLHTNAEQGLQAADAGQRLKQYGRNALEEKEKVSSLLIFLRQLKSPFVVLLITAAGLSLYFSEVIDAIAIVVVILANAIIGFFMEYQAEKSMEALKKMTVVPGKVVRDGKVIEVPSDEIVPGDVLFAEAGDMISADARLASFSELQVNESSLTGESVPVEKQTKILKPDIPLAERTNMLFKGTHVTKGNGKAIVIATGMKTELGKIASMVQEADEAITPLEKKIRQFSKKLIWLTLILIALIFAAGLIHGNDITKMVGTSIALAVAAIPEGLPIVTTLALAQGMLRMARSKVIVKKLSAVETLGGTTVICTDKTGTLTENHIEVSSVRLEGKDFQVSAQGKGQTEGRPGGEGYRFIQLVAVLCNTAEIAKDSKGDHEVGDPLETGLLRFVAAEKEDILKMRADYPKVKEEPFKSETRIMATTHQAKDSYFTCAKGAVDELLEKCTEAFDAGKVVKLTPTLREKFTDSANEMAASGLRVIAAAYKETRTVPETLSEKLTFVGLIGMLDPLRKEVPGAIKECKQAGIKVIMITGDHPATAKNIGLKLGLVESEDEPVLHGKDVRPYDQLDEKEKDKLLETRIFARVSPQQKLDLVRLLQEKHEVVGMTGDGVNDAPALKKADIGIAMGQRGTQVAQEVSDMVLKDDSFSSIVAAIKQGRVIFENIRKFILFLLSCNLSELLLIAMTSVVNSPYALLPIQILYINLVTDVLPALALGVTKASVNVMTKKPRHSSEPIINAKYWRSLIVYSLAIASASFAAVYFIDTSDGSGSRDGVSNNVLFLTLIFAQLFHVFNVTGDTKKSFFKTEIMRNKYVWYALGICSAITFATFFIKPVALALRLETLSIAEWGVIFAFSLLSMIVNWLLKRLKIIA